MLTGDGKGVYEMCILQVVVTRALARGEVTAGGMVCECVRGLKVWKEVVESPSRICGTGSDVCWHLDGYLKTTALSLTCQESIAKEACSLATQ